MTSFPRDLEPDDPTFDREASMDWFETLDRIYKVVQEASEHLNGQLNPVVGASTLPSRAHRAAQRLLVDEPPGAGDYDTLVDIRDLIGEGLSSQNAGVGGGHQILEDLDQLLKDLRDLDPRVTSGPGA